MDLLEYQGKQLFAEHGVPVPAGRHATTASEARIAAEELGFPVVIKAQVQIGGRGKAGGIKLANDADEAEAHAKAILGMDIRGLTVHEIWVEEASDIAAEYYAAVVFDRSAKKPLLMLSAAGGMDIEAVAEDKIARLHVDPLVGLRAEEPSAWSRRAASTRTSRARRGRWWPSSTTSSSRRTRCWSR